MKFLNRLAAVCFAGAMLPLSAFPAVSVEDMPSLPISPPISPAPDSSEELLPANYAELVNRINQFGNVQIVEDGILIYAAAEGKDVSFSLYSTDTSDALTFEIEEKQVYYADSCYPLCGVAYLVTPLQEQLTLACSYILTSMPIENEVYDLVELVGTWEFRMTDDGLKETDIFGYVPDGYYEASNFADEHGSPCIVQDDDGVSYLVYCYSSPAGTPTHYELNDRGSTAEYSIISDRKVILLDDTMMEGWGRYVVTVIRPDSAGTLQFGLDTVDFNGVTKNSETSRFDVNDELAFAAPGITIGSGDVNADRSIDSTDVKLLQGWLLGKPSDCIFWNADMNGDGVVDVFDLALLKRKVRAFYFEAVLVPLGSE